MVFSWLTVLTFCISFAAEVMLADSCCISLCPDSDCPNCSKAECLADRDCRVWSCGTFDPAGSSEDDCLFWWGSTCAPGAQLGSACNDPDGSPSLSYCEVMPPEGQRPTWATNERRVCARRKSA